MSACRGLEDQIANVQCLIQQSLQSSRYSEEELKSRVDASLQFIATLRNEVEAQKQLLTERKRQNGDLASELNQTKNAGDSKRVDNSRLKVELQIQTDQNEALGLKKRQLTDDSCQER